LSVLQRGKQCRHKWLKMLNAIRWRAKDDNNDVEASQLLLKGEVSISCDERIKTGLRSIEELAILEARPTLVGRY